MELGSVSVRFLRGCLDSSLVLKIAKQREGASVEAPAPVACKACLPLSVLLATGLDPQVERREKGCLPARQMGSEEGAGRRNMGGKGREGTRTRCWGKMAALASPPGDRQSQT